MQTNYLVLLNAFLHLDDIRCLLKEMPLPLLRPCQLALARLPDFLRRHSLFRHTTTRSRRGRRSSRWFFGWKLCRALDVLWVSVVKLDVGETHPRHEISALEITVHLFEAADLARHHQGPDLAFEVVTLRFPRLWELLVCAALSYPLDFLFPYGVANPLRGMRLARAQEDFRRRLRHHRLRFVAVTHFQLAASLKTQHDWIVGFAVLRDRRVQLRQPLQGRQFVQNEPHRTRTHAALIHQAQH